MPVYSEICYALKKTISRGNLHSNWVLLNIVRWNQLNDDSVNSENDKNHENHNYVYTMESSGHKK